MRLFVSMVRTHCHMYHTALISGMVRFLIANIVARSKLQ